MATLTIDLDPALEQDLRDAAQRDGLPVTEFVIGALRGLLSLAEPTGSASQRRVAGSAGAGASKQGGPSRAVPTVRRPISERFAEIMGSVPKDELAQVPTDLSENLDHYLYGAPKKP